VNSVHALFFTDCPAGGRPCSESQRTTVAGFQIPRRHRRSGSGCSEHRRVRGLVIFAPSARRQASSAQRCVLLRIYGSSTAAMSVASSVSGRRGRTRAGFPGEDRRAQVPDSAIGCSAIAAGRRGRLSSLLAGISKLDITEGRRQAPPTSRRPRSPPRAPRETRLVARSIPASRAGAL
jgi:hypothetical protein